LSAASCCGGVLSPWTSRNQGAGAEHLAAETEARSSMHAPGEGTRPTDPWLGLNDPVFSLKAAVALTTDFTDGRSWNGSFPRGRPLTLRVCGVPNSSPCLSVISVQSVVPTAFSRFRARRTFVACSPGFHPGLSPVAPSGQATRNWVVEPPRGATRTVLETGTWKLGPPV
jgi:hypothetical protein